MGPQGTVVQIGLVWLEAAAEPENGTEKIKFFGFFWVGGQCAKFDLPHAY